jgi:hypothetical protein
MIPKTGDFPLDPPPPKSLGDHGTGFLRETSPMLTLVGKRAVAENTHSNPLATNPAEDSCTIKPSDDITITPPTIPLLN